MDYKDLGKRIGQLRRGLGLTQKELAEMLGVTDKAVSKWETGRSLPDPALLLPLAARLGTTVDHLLGGAEAPDGESPAPELGRVEPLAAYASGLMARTRKRARVLPAILFVALLALGVFAAIHEPSVNSLDAIIDRGPLGQLVPAELTRQEEALLDFSDLGSTGGEYFTCRVPEGMSVTAVGFYRFIEGSWEKCGLWEGKSDRALLSLSAQAGTYEIHVYTGAGGLVGISHDAYPDTVPSIAAFAGSDSVEDPSIDLSPGTFMVPVVWGATLADEMLGPMVPSGTEAQWLEDRETPGPGEERVCLFVTIE